MDLKEIKEIRRDNLNELIQNHGSTAEINERLGRKRNHPSLTQIRNRSPRGNGTFYEMGDKLARLLEDKLELPRGWMDTEHTGIVIPSGDDEFDDEISVKIPEYGGGAGMSKQHHSMEEVLVGDIRLSRLFLRTLGYQNPQGLTTTTAYGDSMAPTIYPGAKVLVDSNVREFVGNGIYLLYVAGNESIKRISMNMKGKLLVSTDNPNEQLSELLDGSEEIEIRGRVIYHWNGVRD